MTLNLKHFSRSFLKASTPHHQAAAEVSIDACRDIYRVWMIRQMTWPQCFSKWRKKTELSQAFGFAATFVRFALFANSCCTLLISFDIFGSFLYCIFMCPHCTVLARTGSEKKPGAMDLALKVISGRKPRRDPETLHKYFQFLSSLILKHKAV